MGVEFGSTIAEGLYRMVNLRRLTYILFRQPALSLHYLSVVGICCHRCPLMPTTANNAATV
jgi:hypothetical protein